MCVSHIRSDPASGYSKEGILKPQDSPLDSPTHSSPYRSAVGPPPLPSGPNPKALGSLPSNWEIAYTENNEKYFIE